MDPFAQQMLEKARLRCKNFGIETNALEEFERKQKAANQIETSNEKNMKPLTKNDYKTSSKQKFTLEKENIDVEVNVTSGHRIDMVQIEVQEAYGDSEKKIGCPNEEKGKAKIRDISRNRLKRLGVLYSDADEISSPIHRTENQFCEETPAEAKEILTRKPQKLNKLAELAKEIKNWEDEDENKKSRKNFDYHKIETTNERQTNDENENTKKLKWDNTVMQSLEAQGFQRRESSTTKLSYDYKNNIEKNNDDNIKSPKVNENYTTKTTENLTKVQKTISVFNSESKQNDSRKSIGKDPSDLPLKERMKLFEQNKGQAPVPRVPFGMNVPAKKVCEKAVQEHMMLKSAHDKTTSISKETLMKKPDSNVDLHSKLMQKPNLDTNNKIKNTYKLYDNQLQQAKISNNETNIVKKTIKENIGAIVLQFEKGVENHNTDSSDMTKEKATKTSPKRLYPDLNEFKSFQTESGNDANEYSTEAVCDTDEPQRKTLRKSTESSIEDPDLSLNISYDSINLEKPQVRFDLSNKNETSKVPDNYNADHYNSSDSSINSKTTENSGEMSDYLNDALDSDTDDNASVTTNTDSIIKAHDYTHSPSTAHMGQVKSKLSLENSEENTVTLVHTISFYRKQQAGTSNPSTPIRKVIRDQEIKRTINEENEVSETDGSYDIDEREIEVRLVNEKIGKLRDEVCKQHQIIAQASQALNLCAATIEFSGSTEAVEGERHLLVATHRRQAALDEIQRLRVEGVLRPSGAPKEKGRLTVKEITIPLRQDYIRKLSNDAISGHHLLCLLKYNETVLATQTIPTLPGLVAVKFPDVLHLNDVYADFRVTLEVYGMTAQREILPHDIKYHININKNKHLRTPKKKNCDSRLVMPIVQSPAGPNVVRTPALVQYGFAIFSLREVQRNTWTLTKVSGVSPLEGTISMKINSELSVSIAYKGFLTMFEDISGFGAWHRRWCYLNGHIINYWKYPDDEKKSAPIGSIDLNFAITQKVTTAPREICARLNTIMLECKDQCQDDGVSRKSSLMSFKENGMIITRYLLSADTKEERDEWCAYLNKALMLLKAWSSATEKNESSV